MQKTDNKTGSDPVSAAKEKCPADDPIDVSKKHKFVCLKISIPVFFTNIITRLSRKNQ